MPRFPHVLFALLVSLVMLPACATTSGSAGSGLSALTAMVSRPLTVSSAGSELVIPPGESLVIAEASGPAVIDRVWVGLEGLEHLARYCPSDHLDELDSPPSRLLSGTSSRWARALAKTSTRSR